MGVGKAVKGVAAVAATVVLGGCGTEPEPVPVSDLSLYVASARRTIGIESAAEIVIVQQCMERQGFEYYTPDISGIGSNADGVSQLFIFDSTVEEAADTGYETYVDSQFFQSSLRQNDSEMSGDEEAMSTSLQHFESYFAALSTSEQARWREAYDGGDDGARLTTELGSIGYDGCLREGLDAVMGDDVLAVLNTFDRVQMLGNQVVLDSDPEFAVAIEGWKSCMAESGYPFESPYDAIAAGVALRGDSVSATELETKQAVADATCQESSGLPEVMQAAYSRVQRSLVEDNVELMLTWDQLQVSLLARSSEILGVDFEQTRSPGDD